ncbi:unnamed protein product [Hydatigera taeniaeformis]|uniref:Zinc finger CCHC domain-containing protein 7 n=1 Tax=Hydatigena taeniaeformis TaxID=6205 RepID=A0A0R3X6Y7_HYDTA|nr:unnamed protein product [Hydatigera taeniaeformis]
MEEEESEYDSDHVDEETEARLYASVFYDNDPIIASKSPAANSKKSFNLPDLLSVSTDKHGEEPFISTSRESTSTSPPIDSTLMAALYLTFTGRTPHSVIQKAEERMDRYVEQNGVGEHPVYAYVTDTSSDSSLADNTLSKRPKLDLLLGLSEPLVDNLKENTGLLEQLKDLPSDGKYWSLDSPDLSSSSKKKRRCREADMTCERCYKKGHTFLECIRAKGHTVRDCPNRCCSVCNEFGHDSSRCRSKIDILNTVCSRCKRRGHEINTCPDIWRQYRYTTRPGKPVVAFPPPIRRAKSCFNCGGRGHTGEWSCPISLLHSYFVSNFLVLESTSTAESTSKTRVFDEPLYCSFENGISSQLPQPSFQRISPLEHDGSKKVQGGGKLAANKLLRSRNKTNHGDGSAKIPRKQSLFDANSRRHRSGGQAFRISNRQTSKDSRNGGALARSRKRKHPGSSVFREAPAPTYPSDFPARSIQKKSKQRSNHLGSLAEVKGSQCRKPTVRLRLGENKRSKERGFRAIEDLPNIATSPYLKMLHPIGLESKL